MPIGPGKYDDLATYVREASKAESVILIVANDVGGGRIGDCGFSVQSSSEVFVMHIPQILRSIADEIENDLSRGDVREPK